MAGPGDDVDFGFVPPLHRSTPQEYDRLRRRVLWSVPNGLFLLGTTGTEGPHAMSTSWFTQVATTPKLVAAGVEADSLTASNILTSGHFLVALLSHGGRPLIRKFAKRRQELTRDVAGLSIEGVPFELDRRGDPYPKEAIALLSATVTQDVELGSHILFIGEVTDAQVLTEGERALTVADTRLNYGG